jgi:hypothetical protein
LTTDVALNDDFEVTLTDISGRILLHQTVQNSLDWATDYLPSGIYFLKISSKGNVETHKLFKF